MIAVGKDAQSGLSVAALWERRGFLLSLVAGALALAGILLVVITPSYTSEALVALTINNSPAFDRVATLPVAPTEGQVRTEIEVIRSRELAAQVVDQLGLVRDPEFNRSLETPSPIIAKIKELAVDAVALLPEGMQPTREPVTEATIRAKTIDAVMKALTVKADPVSYAIHVGFKARTADKSARIANAFADIYVLGLLKNKFDDIERATGWVSKQVSSLQQQANEAAKDAATFREKNKLGPMSIDPGLMASQQVVALTQELGQAEAARADAEVKLRQASGWLRKPDDLPPVELVAQSPFIQSLRAQEAVVMARLAEMRTRYRDDQPAVVSLANQLATLRHNIATEVQKVQQALSSQVAQARSREAVLHQRIDEITKAANQKAGPQIEMAQRQRDIDSKNAMLQTFMARYTEIANRMEIEKPDARVVSRAMPPTSPTHPKPLLFLGIALIGSLGLGVALVALLERFRPGFLSTGQVRSELGLPTLGVVPQLRRLPNRTVPSEYMIEKPTSSYAEAIKSAQLAILDARPDSQTKRILVASSLPGEGKTSFSISLARSLASSGHRTLLLDCDFRRPLVHRHFNVKATPGLVDLLKDEAPVEDILHKDAKTGLFFAPAGSRTDDPQKLLDSQRTSSTIANLTDGFDVVIIDTPPTMVASDSAVLARETDLVLYVVAWDKTPRGAVQAGVEYLQSRGGRVAGVILSKVDMSKSGNYGDYVDYAFRYDDYYAR